MHVHQKHTYICVNVHACVHTLYSCIHTSICMYMHTCMCTCIYVYACICACMYMHVCIPREIYFNIQSNQWGMMVKTAIARSLERALQPGPLCTIRAGTLSSEQRSPHGRTQDQNWVECQPLGHLGHAPWKNTGGSIYPVTQVWLIGKGQKEEDPKKAPAWRSDKDSLGKAHGSSMERQTNGAWRQTQCER